MLQVSLNLHPGSAREVQACVPAIARTTPFGFRQLISELCRRAPASWCFPISDIDAPFARTSRNSLIGHEPTSDPAPGTTPGRSNTLRQFSSFPTRSRACGSP